MLWVMDDGAVDRVMASYENLPALEHLGREEIRVKVGQYLAKLSSAGHSDVEELIPRFIDSPKNRLPWGDFGFRHGA
jgi:hypothetical protein